MKRYYSTKRQIEGEKGAPWKTEEKLVFVNYVLVEEKRRSRGRKRKRMRKKKKKKRKV